MRNSRKTLRAELIGSDKCTAAGITARATSPVLAMCRRLIAAGYDPDAALHAYRNDTLCLRIRSIGAAARLEINSGGTGFVVARAVRAAPPVHLNRRAGIWRHEPRFSTAGATAR
jgi:hypothetical protein